MGQILAIVSSKGGVGKTTTAVNLAAAFASLDFPTLLVEADPQCGIVANFGFDRFDIPRGLAEVARRQARADEVTFETSVEGLHLVSSNVWSQAEEGEYLKALEADPLVFKEQLASVAAAYDYVVIDAPPMLGPITVAILAAAHRFIVPLQTEPQALRSLGRLVETAGQVRDRYNRGLIFDGIALTMVDSRTRLSLQVIEQVQVDYPELAFTNSIPRSVRLSEMATAGRPLVVAAPSSRGARAYAALAEEILLKHARERMIERAGDDDDGDDNTPGDPPTRPEVGSPEVGSHEVGGLRDGASGDDLLGDDLAHDDAARDGGLDDDELDDGAMDDDAAGFEALQGRAGREERLVDATAAEPGRQPVVGTAAAALPGDPPLTGRIAIASGRIPEQGGDIHKSRRKARNGHVTLLPPGVSGGPRSAAGGGTPGAGAAAAQGGPARPTPAHGGSTALDPSTGTVDARAGQSSFLDDETADEWNEENFVDLDTYMKMEAGETAGAGALAADEDDWSEEWGQ